MLLAAGTMLGPYQLAAKVGEGGMGDVYKATDVRIGRTVAVKVLSPHLAPTPDLKQRFDREARAIGALNHPHICVLHDVGHANGTDYLVMEYVEGDTLAAKLAAQRPHPSGSGRQPLPFEDVMRYAIQIAEALTAAHHHHIVHRDLKPANVMLTKTGIKLLDFGLAKLREPLAPNASADVNLAPTQSVPLTSAHMVLGTLQYMAPEQLLGKEVDARSDVFAFGAVVYEMATGHKAFDGPSGQQIAAAILESDPPAMLARQKRASAAFDRIVGKCLAKDPDERWQTARDLASELRWIAAQGQPTSSPPVHTPMWRALAIASGVVTVVFGGLLWWSLTRPAVVPSPDVVQFTIPLPPGEVFPIGQGVPSFLTISPDGGQIVYAARHSGGDRLYLRRPRDLTPTPLPGTEGAIGPFFSPDGKWIGFASGGLLKKLQIGSGGPQTIAPAPNLSGASWGVDGTIVYGPERRGELFAVSAAGGEPRALSVVNARAQELGHGAPHVLPDGKNVLLTVTTSPDGVAGPSATGPQHVDVLEIATGRRKSLVEGRNPYFLATGHLVFARREAVFVAPFDPTRLELTGPPVQVLAGVRAEPGDTLFAVSRAGTLVHISSEVRARHGLVRVNREGQPRPFTDQRATFQHPRISPDGTRVVVQVAGPQELWIYDVAPGTRTRLRSRGTRPIWMPNGRSVMFQDQGRLFSAPVDDNSEPELVLSAGEGVAFPLAWSRDGRMLVYSHYADPQTGRDLWVLPANGEPTPFLRTPRDERAAMFSPDGRWVVYAAKEIGRDEQVYVQPYPGPGPGARVVISRDGGVEPVWSPTGREIFYRSIDGRRMMAADVRTEPTLSVGTARVLFEGPYRLGVSLWADYDVWPDGNEFLMVADDEAPPPGIHVFIDWLGEVRRRIAAPQ